MAEKPEAQKRAHAEVKYEHPSEHGSQRCLVCEHFIKADPPRCEGVKGPIEREDWCKRFVHIFT